MEAEGTGGEKQEAEVRGRRSDGHDEAWPSKKLGNGCFSEGRDELNNWQSKIVRQAPTSRSKPGLAGAFCSSCGASFEGCQRRRIGLAMKTEL